MPDVKEPQSLFELIRQLDAQGVTGYEKYAVQDAHSCELVYYDKDI